MGSGEGNGVHNPLYEHVCVGGGQGSSAAAIVTAVGEYGELVLLIFSCSLSLLHYFHNKNNCFHVDGREFSGF